jgi:hypothetical protein
MPAKGKSNAGGFEIINETRNLKLETINHITIFAANLSLLNEV